MDRPGRLVDSGCLGVVPARRRRSRVIVSFGVVARAWSCLLIRYGAGESDVANASGLQIDAARTGNIEDTFTNEDDEAAHANDSRGQAVHAEAWPVSRVHLLLHRDSRPGAVEVDLQRFFRVTPPVVLPERLVRSPGVTNVARGGVLFDPDV